ncbi:histidine phosphatase family protein [Thioalkalivibrio thiocyanoxidans]|uniref:histidine phosphatase family protein n=1 Tax=Thioalkalivibrio thiocyanoxidans TaxID=152475 RepID=UPI00036772FE|nr:histidine phosphatase family protein [Thioalkalivibrio thiocyanoxidans]
MIVDLLRHGEPEGGQRYRGHGCDDPLSAQGWTQMEHAVRDDDGWQAVVSSPMRRCRAFAERLVDERDLSLHLEPGLREVGFGDWEGCTRVELQRERPDEYRAFYADPVHSRPAGAEPLGAFRRRVETAFETAVGGQSAERVLVIVHAGVIRALVGWVMGVPDERLFQLECEYASRTRLHRHPTRGWRVIHTNRLP